MDKAIESEEDLYEVLGVAPEASDADIKKVYRKLVLKYHPDKLAGKSEEEQRASQDTFQKLVTAYEVLSNPHQRAIYDTRAAKKGGKQDDVFLNITLKESVVGAKKLAPVPFKKRCSACKSLGMICKPCEPCGGKPSWASNGPKCTVCQGRGFGEPQVCDVCKGHGETEEFDMVRLEIPAGAATGTRIPVPGKSVHARVFVLPSKIFRRDGDNIESVLELTEEEAEEGGPFEVETLHGKDAVFLIGPLSTGDTKVLPGKGVAAHDGGKAPAGDHIVRIEVKPSGKRPQPPGEEPGGPAPKRQSSQPAQPAAASAAPPQAQPPAPVDPDAVARQLAERKAALLAKLREQQAK